MHGDAAAVPEDNTVHCLLLMAMSSSFDARLLRACCRQRSHRIGGADLHPHQRQQEVAVVVGANTRVHPGAVVIHLQDAPEGTGAPKVFKTATVMPVV
jgi:hypothetical protein